MKHSSSIHDPVVKPGDLADHIASKAPLPSGKTVFIVRGVPGSGKTRFVEQYVTRHGLVKPPETDRKEWKPLAPSALQYRVFETNMFRDYSTPFSPSLLSTWHSKCQNGVVNAMQQGVPYIFITNTNITARETAKYVGLAVSDADGCDHYSIVIVGLNDSNKLPPDELFSRCKSGAPQRAIERMVTSYEHIQTGPVPERVSKYVKKTGIFPHH